MDCPDGGEWLCSTHYSDHSKSKSSRHHRPLSLEALQQQGGIAIVDSMQSSCMEHGQELNVFCETCDTVVCQLCALSKRHRGHEFDLVEDALHKSREHLRAEIPSLSRELDEITRSLEAVQEMGRNVAIQAEGHRSKIDGVFDGMIATVEEARRQKHDEMRMMFWYRNESLCQQVVELDSKREAIQSVLHFMERSIRDPGFVTFLAMKGSIIGRREQLRKRITATEPSAKDDMQVIWNTSEMEKAILALHNMIIVEEEQKSLQI